MGNEIGFNARLPQKINLLLKKITISLKKVWKIIIVKKQEVAS